MKKYSLALLLTCVFGLWSFAQTSQPITDPVQDFKARMDHTGFTNIYKLEVDINNDGLKEVFLSFGPGPDAPDAEEWGWEMYIAKPGGTYSLSAGEVTPAGVKDALVPGFSKTYYWIGMIPEINQYGLLHFVVDHGRQATCRLWALVINGNGFTDIPIGQPVSVKDNLSTLEARFPNPLVPAIQTIPITP